MGPSPSLSLPNSLTKLSVTNLTSFDLTLISRHSHYNIVKNNKTNQLLEQYDTVHDGLLTLEEELEFYEYRKLQNKHLVKVEHVIKGNSAGLCSNKEVYKVFSERIEIRLDEMQELDFLEGAVILVSVLEGLDAIKDGYPGVLNLTERMVGVNQRGVIKVWINECFERNLPGYGGTTKGYYGQGKVVGKVFELVRKRMKNKKYPQDFQKVVQKCDGWKYQRAIREVRNFVGEFDVEIPRTLNRYCQVKELKDVQEASPFQLEVNEVPNIQFVHFQPLRFQQRQITPQLNTVIDRPHILTNNPILSLPSYTNNVQYYRPQFQKSQSSNNTSTSSNSQRAFTGLVQQSGNNSKHKDKDVLGQKIEDLSLTIKRQLETLKHQLSSPSYPSPQLSTQ